MKKRKRKKEHTYTSAEQVLWTVIHGVQPWWVLKKQLTAINKDWCGQSCCFFVIITLREINFSCLEISLVSFLCLFFLKYFKENQFTPWSIHTWDHSVPSLNSVFQQRAAQLQILLGDCNSDPTISGELG